MPIIEPKPHVVVCKTCGVRHEEALYSTIPVPGNWCSLECYRQGSRPWGVEWASTPDAA